MENATVSKCGLLLERAEPTDGVTAPEMSTESSPLDQSVNDPLFYIITVLMFYACSIVILMVKYIRRERQEAEFNNYYYEYVTREKFQNPQYQNFQCMCRIMKSVTCGKGRKITPTNNDILCDNVALKTKVEIYSTDTEVNASEVEQKLLHVNETTV